MKMHLKIPLTIKIILIGVFALLSCIMVLLIPIPDKAFDPVPWLTLIVGGAFGVAITIIANTRSQVVLDFLKNSERERQIATKRRILSDAHEIQQSTRLFFDTISGRQLTVAQKKDLLMSFLPRFKVLTSLSQNAIPSLGNLLPSDDMEKIEACLKVLSDLLIILELGNDDHFKNNIAKLDEYSKNLVEKLNETEK